jgi:DNA-binding LytR/AlgR family response regulator
MIDGMMTCVAVDDEPLALSVIERFCERKGNLLLHCFGNPDEAMEYIALNRPDLVFLDIEMDEKCGLELAANLPKGTCVIFTTAYVKYAMDGYELGVVDFLHKPFSYDRFSKAVDKARLIAELINSKASLTQTVTVKEDYTNVHVPLSDIIYVEAMNNYCKIYRMGDSCISSRTSLKSFLEQLPQEGFLRIHRSFVISLDKVLSYNRSEVRMVGGRSIPIGRQFAGEVAAVLGK